MDTKPHPHYQTRGSVLLRRPYIVLKVMSYYVRSYRLEDIKFSNLPV